MARSRAISPNAASSWARASHYRCSVLFPTCRLLFWTFCTCLPADIVDTVPHAALSPPDRTSFYR